MKYLVLMFIVILPSTAEAQFFRRGGGCSGGSCGNQNLSYRFQNYPVQSYPVQSYPVQSYPIRSTPSNPVQSSHVEQPPTCEIGPAPTKVPPIPIHPIR